MTILWRAIGSGYFSRCPFVISSLQASLWKALQIIGYDFPIAGYGRLLGKVG
jgi:maleate cis-trans isomerase